MLEGPAECSVANAGAGNEVGAGVAGGPSLREGSDAWSVAFDCGEKMLPGTVMDGGRTVMAMVALRMGCHSSRVSRLGWLTDMPRTVCTAAVAAPQ